MNDGNIHTVRLVRKGREGSMELDDAEPVAGRSGGILAMLNTEGNIFVGGVPRLLSMTGGKHQVRGVILDLLRLIGSFSSSPKRALCSCS